MARQVIFTDEKGNEITTYVNSQNKIYINSGENGIYNGGICLTLEDAIEFRDELTRTINQLDNLL